MRLLGRLFTAIFVASLILPAAVAGPALAADATTHLSITNPAVQVAGVQFQVAVSALDGLEALDPTYEGTIHFSSSDPDAVLPGDDAGLGTAGGTQAYSVTLKSAGSQTITVADDEGHGPVSTASFNVDPGPASTATSTIDASPTTATIDDTSTITVHLFDVFGNARTSSGGAVVTLASDGDGVISGLVDNANGTWTADLTDLTVETAIVTGHIGSNQISVTATVDFSHGAAAHLVFKTSPGSGTSGVVLAPNPVVEVQDAGGNPVTISGTSISMAIGTGPGTLSGTTSAPTDSNGDASFSNLLIVQAAAGYTLLASGGSASAATSASFDIAAGAADHLVFTTQPGDGFGGATLSTSPVIEVRDAAENPVEVLGTPITVSIGAGPGALSGTMTVNTAVNGRATFTNLSIDLAANGYTLDAAASGLTGATSNPFDINVGGADHLAFSVSPSSGTVAIAFGAQPEVEVRDAGENVVTGATDAVALSITGSPADATLTCTSNTVNAAAGIASFGTCQINRAGTYTLTATDGVTGAVSAPFTISAGAADHLGFTTQPGGGTATTVWTAQPVVEVQDAENNRVTGATNSVLLSVTGSPAGVTLTCTANPQLAVSGVDTFVGCNINQVGTSYTVTAHATGLVDAMSSAFDITANVATHLVFSTVPSGSSGGIVLATQPVVTFLDAGGNVATGSTDAVSLSLTAPNGATLSCTANPVSAVAGVATLEGCKVDKAGDYTLQAVVTAGPPTITTPISIIVGAADHLAFTAGSPTATGGTPFVVQPAVQVQDAGNNLVTGATDSITIAIDDLNSPAGGTLSGGPLTVAAVAGVATFSGLSIDKANIGYRLIATSGSLLPDRTGTIDITVGDTTHLAFVQQPNNAVQGVAIVPAITVQLLDAGGNLVTGDTTTLVDLAIGNNPSGGTMGGTLAMNAVNGIATWPNTSINLAGVGYTLTATATGPTGDTSTAFDITLQPNHAPSGTDGSLLTNEDTAYAFTPADFPLTDNADLPPNVLAGVKITSLPTAGTLLDNGSTIAAGTTIPLVDLTGGLTYTPALNGNGANYATFTFQVQDNGGTGSGGIDLDPTPRTMTANVTPVDDAPVAVNDSFVIKQGGSLVTAYLTGVLPNDTDVESPTATLTAAVVTGPTNGSLAFNANGSFTYTPTTSYIGPDSFTYQASDGILPSNVATASINVYLNHPPIAASDIRWVTEGSHATALGVLANDYQINPDDGETLRITAVGHASHGTVAIIGGGADVSYRPKSGFTGTDIFSYTVSDGQFSTSTSVLVHVPKDKIKPTTTAPAQTVGGQTVGARTVVVRIAWTGADVGTGVVKYQLQQKKNSGSWATVKLSSALSRSSNRSLSFGSYYQFRVRATDKRGNVGAWSYGPKFRAGLAQETSATFAGTWVSRTSTSYSGRHERTTTVAGSSATFTTTGRTMAWIGVRAKTRGVAQVFVDGVFVGNVNLHLTSTRYHYVVFSRTFATSAVHTIQIVFADVSSRMADVDGFIILR